MVIRWSIDFKQSASQFFLYSRSIVSNPAINCVFKLLPGFCDVITWNVLTIVSGSTDIFLFINPDNTGSARFNITLPFLSIKSFT